MQRQHLEQELLNQQAQRQVQELFQDDLNRQQQQQQQQQQQAFFSSAASQDSVQLGANTLLFMANNATAQSHAPSSSQSAFPRMSQSSHITTSQMPFRSETTRINGNRPPTSTQQSQYQFDVQRDFHGIIRLDRNQGSHKSRDIWLPNGMKTSNEYNLEKSEMNGRDSITPHSNISSMDRPSHWGSKPKCTRRPEKKTKTKPSENNKKTSRESFGFGERSLVGALKSGPKAGMIVQFPPSKISTEAGKLDSTSFKPLWLKAVTPNIDFDMSGTNLRDRMNVDEIQEVRGEVMVKSVETSMLAAEDPKENRVIVTHTSPQASRQLSFSSGGYKDRNIDKTTDKEADTYHDSHTVRQTDWRSPGSKALKGGKKVRSKAGSLKAIYQKLTRNIEEKECRMLNMTGSNDPQDPRNRALFYIDITVVDEREVWPFRIISSYISKIERKQRKQPRRSETEVKLFDPSLFGDHTSKPTSFEGAESAGDQYRCDGYQQTSLAEDSYCDRSIEIEMRSNLSAAADSRETSDELGTCDSIEFRSSDPIELNDLPRSDVLPRQRTDGSSIPAPSEQGVLRGAVTNSSTERNNETLDSMAGHLTLNRNQEQGVVSGGETGPIHADQVSPFQVGMHASVYFKADGFQKGKERNVPSGTVIRVYDPEVFYDSTVHPLRGSNVSVNSSGAINDGYHIMNSSNDRGSCTGVDTGKDRNRPLETSGSFCQTFSSSCSSSKQPLESTCSCTDIEGIEDLGLREGRQYQNAVTVFPTTPIGSSNVAVLKIICTQLYEILKS
jgi:hypothetical protein